MYDIFKLNNGLRVVVENIDYVNSVSVGLWIENGSRNENSFNNGISHFIEHMLFKGTTSRNSKEIAECIEDVGGQINAFTGKEATCFYIKILDSHLNLALDVISDMLLHSKFNPEDIEKEKSVIAEEINMSEDSPEDVLMDLQNEAAFKGDSISLPILGTLDSLNNLKRDDIIKYISSYYIPENSVISISGKFDLKTIKLQVEHYFGEWSSNNKKLTHYSTPVIQHNILYKEKKIEQLHIGLGLTGIKLGDDRIYSLLLLNNILGGGASSILFQKIREEKSLCYSIYSYLSNFNNVGVVGIYTSLNSSYAFEAVTMLKEEIKAFSESGISQEKLEKAKEQIKGSYMLGLESTSSRMFSNGKSVLFLNRINTPENVLNKINAINMATLHDVMEISFKQGIQNAAFVGKNVDFMGLKTVTQEEIFAYKNKESFNI